MEWPPDVRKVFWRISDDPFVVILSEAVVDRLPKVSRDCTHFEKEARENKLRLFWRNKAILTEEIFMEDLGATEKEFNASSAKLKEHLGELRERKLQKSVVQHTQAVADCLKKNICNPLICQRHIQKWECLLSKLASEKAVKQYLYERNKSKFEGFKHVDIDELPK